MKHRSSVKKAEWTNTREDWYKKECDKILFRTKSKIIIEDSRVFLEVHKKKEPLLEITNPKTKWFEIWLHLRDIK